MIVGFHHAGIVVPDLELATGFYTQALGFEISSNADWESSESGSRDEIIGLRETSAQCRVLRGPNCFLELFQFRAPEPAGDPMSKRPCDFGVAHLSFQVIDIFSVFERVRAAGGIAHRGPVPFGDGYSIYCRDPFGNIIELMEISTHEPEFDLIAERMLPQAVQETAEAAGNSQK